VAGCDDDDDTVYDDMHSCAPCEVFEVAEHAWVSCLGRDKQGIVIANCKAFIYFSHKWLLFNFLLL